MSPTPSLRVAQIVIKIRPSSEMLQQQYADVKKARDNARRGGLGKAAAEIGQSTQKSGFYGYENTPQMLFTAPEAAKWGLRAKKGDVSPVFEGLDEFVVVQVTDQLPAGPMSREEAAETERQLAEKDIRVGTNKAIADRVQAGIAAGQTLEAAAAAESLTPLPINDMTRQQPSPQLSVAPEVAGGLFGSPIGATKGPIRAVNGWYFYRVDRRAPADTAMFEQVKGQISTEILQRRQQAFFNGYMAKMLEKAKISDLRMPQQ